MASIGTRITRSAVAAQYVDLAEQANHSVKPVIALTAISEPVLDQFGQGIGEIDIEVFRHPEKDQRFPAPIIV